MSEHDLWLAALGRAIRQLRAERNITARELAVAAGVAPGRLDSIEAGRFDPTYDVFLALAHGLGVKSTTERYMHAKARPEDLDRVNRAFAREPSADQTAQ
jgi:transcriptional regulator with XRE-family HTH domain